jgi:hypothetical protein
VPTKQPTVIPTVVPTIVPSVRPSCEPTVTPSIAPSDSPTVAPTSVPTWEGLHGFKRLDVHASELTSFTRFSLTLPFQFVRPVSGGRLDNVTVSVPLNGTGVIALTVSGVQPSFEVVSIGGVLSYDFTGRSVAIAGDVNGDGCADLIIGVPYAARVYVLYGKQEGFVNMTDGFTIFGTKASDLTGWSVSAAGDVNNDTIADVIIGAPNSVATGAAYVIYGSTDRNHDLHLADMTHWEGFTMIGSASQDALGMSVSGGGDVNGDGYDDVVVGALRANYLNSGAVYVIYGGPLESLQDVSVGSTLSNRVYVISGPSWSWFGYSVAGAGVDHYLILCLECYHVFPCL